MRPTVGQRGNGAPGGHDQGGGEPLHPGFPDVAVGFGCGMCQLLTLARSRAVPVVEPVFEVLHGTDSGVC